MTDAAIILPLGAAGYLAFVWFVWRLLRTPVAVVAMHDATRVTPRAFIFLLMTIVAFAVILISGLAA